MKIAMLSLVTLGYYVMLFFLNKRGKTAFKKNALTVLGDTTSLDKTEDATETDLFGKVNNNVDADTLSELTPLLDANNVLESNMTNMIDDIEVEDQTAPSIILPTEKVEVQDAPSIIPPTKKVEVEVEIETVDLINLVDHEKNSKVFPIQKPDLIQALEGLDNQDTLIEESDIDGLMSQITSKQ